MRAARTWLYDYNREAFGDAYGLDPSEVPEGDLADLLAFGLGYVDYSKPSIADALLEHRYDGREGLGVETRLEGSSEEALFQGLEEVLGNGKAFYGDLSDEEFDAMMAHALGYVDYEVLARERPLQAGGER